MGIHVIQSQRIDVLLQAMLKTTKKTTSNPFDALKTQHIIVPSAAIETWLTTRIAEQKGISANIQFYHRIRGFQWSAYQLVLDAHKDKVRKANIPRIIIKWRLFQLLKPYIQDEQSHLSQQHPLFPIIQRIYASADQLEYSLAQQLKKQDMLYWVTEQVSKLFSHYMTYRSDWLNAWHENRPLNIEQLFFKGDTEISAFTLQQAQELEAWQRWLWQQGFSQDFLEIQQIDTLFWQALGDPVQPQVNLEKLPQQLVVFTLLDLPPSQLHFLRRLGQYIDIFIFHYNPSQEYWADSVDPHWKTRYDVGVKERFIAKNPDATDVEIQQFFSAFTLNFNAQNRESRHPLLTRLGKQARDHFSLLASLSSGEEGVWADLFINEYADHLLAKIQADILYLAEPEPHRYELQPEDDSIQIHVCHSAQRQLEVLKDQLIHWLAQSTAERPRKPSDILVLVPNLKELEPLIRSHFIAPPHTTDAAMTSRLISDSIYLPIQISGVIRLDIQHAWRAVLGRIELIQGRFHLEDFADWLSLNATLCRYDLELNQVRRMVELLEKAGFKRGFDPIHLQQYLGIQDQDYRFSFKFALDRLALGIAIPEHVLFHDILSDRQVLPGDFELIAKLIEIYQDFSNRRDWMILHELGEKRHVEQWLKCLMQDVSEFIDAGVDALSTVYTIIKKYQRMLTLADFYDQDQQHALGDLSLPLPYLIAEINQLIEGQLEQAEPTGCITFSQIGQIRPVPYKLMVMLNLDSGKFPNRNVHLPFDLMQLLKPQLGDRSRLEDDQGAFLDLLLLAQDNLWLFYNGFDVSDGEVREPSHVLQELIQHLTLIIAKPDPQCMTMKMITLNGLTVPQHIQHLYHVHPLQPFDPAGFEDPAAIRYQDQWFQVAYHIRYPQGTRQQWANIPYPLFHQDIHVLDSQQWINDMIFPARLYLKTLGVQNLNPQDIPDQFEPLLLDGLTRYRLRNFLHQHDALSDPALLMDQLPVGKIQHSAWQLSQFEQAQLQQRLKRYAAVETVTTSQLWRIEPDLYINISLPKQHCPDWVTLSAASARAHRRAKQWLEYLLWLAYLNLGEGGMDYRRIIIFSDKTIVCQGVSSNQARQYLTDWFSAWRDGQSQPLVLPAALILKCMEKDQMLTWHPDEYGQMQLDNIQDILNLWNDNGQFSPFDVTANEASKFHRDWQFILQQQDALRLLEVACERYAYRLYHPVFCYQQAIED